MKNKEEKETYPCPQCGREAVFNPMWVERDLEWWHCHHCKLDFATITVRQYK